VKDGEHLRMTVVLSEAMDTRVKPAYDDYKQKRLGFLPAVFFSQNPTAAAARCRVAVAAATPVRR
jgi:hypothetical protein